MRAPLNIFSGSGGAFPPGRGPDPIEHVVIQRVLHRVLAFTGRSIHDVINDPIARNEVLGFYKLYHQVQRSGEIRELERQWNPLGR